MKPSAPYIKEIKKDGNQFTVTLEGDLPTGSRAAAAFYDGNGRFLGVSLQDAAEQITVTPPSGTVTVKTMLLDSVWRPICPDMVLQE